MQISEENGKLRVACFSTVVLWLSCMLSISGQYKFPYLGSSSIQNHHFQEQKHWYISFFNFSVSLVFVGVNKFRLFPIDYMRCFINMLCYSICCIFVAYNTFMLWLSFIKPLTGFSNVYLFTIFTWDLVNFVLPSFTRNFWFDFSDKVINRSSLGENNFHTFFFQLLPQNIWLF